MMEVFRHARVVLQVVAIVGLLLVAITVVRMPAETPPSRITDVVVTGYDTWCKVAFSPPTGRAVTGFAITPYVAGVAQAVQNVAGGPNTTSVSAVGLTNGTAYTFTVAPTGPDLWIPSAPVAGTPVAGSFTFTWTVLGGVQVTLPLVGANALTITWGDGASEAWTTAGPRTHTYASSGTMTVSMSGTMTGWAFANGGSCALVRAVTSWGPFAPDATGAFYGCTGLVAVTTTDAPLLTGTCASFFSGCSGLGAGADVGGWVMNRVTDMSNMFNGCNSFNQPLAAWNTGGVTTMASMFQTCASFNQPLAAWNTSGVTTMAFMFGGCYSFNQPLTGWNTGNVTTFNAFLTSATAFDRPLTLDVRKVATSGATAFFGLGMSVANYDASLKYMNALAGAFVTTSSTALGLAHSEDGHAAYVNIVLASGSGGKGWTNTSDLGCVSPRGVSATGSTTVTLTWTAPSYGTVADHRVYYSTDNVTYASFGLTGSTASTATVAGLPSGTYYFKVAAVSTVGTATAERTPSLASGPLTK